MAVKSKSPPTKVPTVAQIRPIVLKITQAHGVKNVRIFGSFARGEQRMRSDVDLLVKMPKKASLFDRIGLKLALEEKLKRKVDVLTDDGIDRYVRDRILAEARPL